MAPSQWQSTDDHAPLATPAAAPAVAAAPPAAPPAPADQWQSTDDHSGTENTVTGSIVTDPAKNVLDDPNVPDARSWGRKVLDEALVNPAKQVAAGAVGAEASANHLTANIFDLLDSMADKVASVTGTDKGGAFKAISDWARGNQAAEEKQAAQLAGGRKDLVSQLYRGGTQGVLSIPTAAVASSVAGPAAGFAALGAISESDKGWKAALQAAAEGALTGAALNVMGPGSRMIRLTGAGAMTYAQARLNGVDNTAALAQATTMAGMAGAPAGGATAGDIARNAMPDLTFKSRLNPTQQAAVDYLRTNDVPLNAGTVTGNKFLKGAQALAANSPLGAGIAADATQATEQGLTRVAGGLADQAHPNASTPESAGAAVSAGLDQKIAGLKILEDQAYGEAWRGADDPQYTQTVPIRTEQRPQLDATGKPTGRMVPFQVMDKVQMPVDVREIKQQLAPIFETMSWMPAADQSASAGYQAARKILTGPDFISAPSAEMGLGGLKTMARVGNADLRNTAQGMAAGVIPALQDAVNDAVAKTGAGSLMALQDGRAQHASKMEVAEVADKLREEPVQAFRQATWSKDTGIGFLRLIQQHAPAALPKVGRAFIQQLFDQATKEGGFSRAQGISKQWENLGDETKKLLYPNPGLRSSLDQFFLGAKLVGENPNPSGTALVSSTTRAIDAGIVSAGLMLESPAAGALAMAGTGAYVLGGKAVAKLLYSPAGVRLLTGAFKPEPPPAAAARLGKILDITGPDDVTPVPPGGKPPNPPTPPAAGNPSANRPILKAGAPNAAPSSPPAGSGAPGESASLPGTPGPVAPADSRAQTTVRVPGSDRSYSATYQVKELADVQASHNGQTFNLNPKYSLRNERDYSAQENQRKILDWSGPGFDPVYHVTNNPDAVNGPPVMDEAGNVLGGNGRTMILQRVYQGNPKGAAAYRAMLTRDASIYGVDPAAIAGMRQPVLVRVIPDSEGMDAGAKRTAGTDFNKTGTAALKPSERAISDSRGVSQSTLDDIGTRLQAMGPSATLAEAMEGDAGPQVLQKLVRDGVVSPQDIAEFEHNGVLTPAGKSRISQLMLGRYFDDPAAIDRTPASVRNKLERMAAPLAATEASPAWSLTEHVKSALRLIEDADTNGFKNLGDYLAQGGLFMSQRYSPRSITLALRLRDMNPNELTDAVRQYAQDSKFAAGGSSLFGEPPTPAEAFQKAFGGDKP